MSLKGDVIKILINAVISILTAISTGITFNIEREVK